ncbi:MaoC/PaaZ C-terminal domain-containing protein [Conexibacter sp. SYSU D00693]|uniref:MaoC family dehydratase n=1 Tax=Conexibacter sp. SYSU D00693 TaxID=2812560 RepID=UPI00196B7A7E|nr:MaoC/PaaZ C-terminal domain-containing protein [Conexibacter sp. SYSU D00693]
MTPPTATAPAAPELRWSAPFEDLAAGQRFRTGWRPVDERDVLGFAALTGDHHPQHVDAAWAARSPFGQRIAHGLLVVSVAAGLVPFDPRRVVALRRLGDVVFKRPVALDEHVRVDGEVAEVRDLPGPAGLVALTWAVRDHDDRLCCRARVEVLWAREDAQADPHAPDADGRVPVFL